MGEHGYITEYMLMLLNMRLYEFIYLHMYIYKGLLISLFIVISKLLTLS
jgi:hypothetical protein